MITATHTMFFTPALKQVGVARSSFRRWSDAEAGTAQAPSADEDSPPPRRARSGAPPYLGRVSEILEPGGSVNPRTEGSDRFESSLRGVHDGQPASFNRPSMYSRLRLTSAVVPAPGPSAPVCAGSMR